MRYLGSRIFRISIAILCMILIISGWYLIRFSTSSPNAVYIDPDIRLRTNSSGTLYLQVLVTNGFDTTTSGIRLHTDIAYQPDSREGCSVPDNARPICKETLKCDIQEVYNLPQLAAGESNTIDILLDSDQEGCLCQENQCTGKAIIAVTVDYSRRIQPNYRPNYTEIHFWWDTKNTKSIYGPPIADM